MTDNQFYLSIAVQITGFLIVGGIAYRAQKGKNEADIEDAPILTKIQETIKQELGHKTAVKSSVYKDRKDAAMKFNETVQDMNTFIGSVRAVSTDISDTLYDQHQNSYRDFIMAVEKAWVKLDVLTNSPKLETDFFEWKYSIGNQFDEIEHYMDNRILYNNFIESKEKTIKEYRDNNLVDRISSIEHHIFYEKDKIASVYKRYIEQRKIHNENVEKASKQLKEDIAKIVADETVE